MIGKVENLSIIRPLRVRLREIVLKGGRGIELASKGCRGRSDAKDEEEGQGSTALDALHFVPASRPQRNVRRH